MLDRDQEWHAANDSLIGDQRDRMLTWAGQSVESMMQELTHGVDKPRWAEKTPAHVLHIRLIHEVFPSAQIIHIIRDGRAVVRSLQNMTWTPQKIRWSTRCWLDNVTTGRDSGKLLPDDCYHEIRYEQLTKDPETSVESICEFLSEPFTPQMLQFNQAKNNSWSKEQKPISSTPINKHRELNKLEKFVFARMATPLMKELGYHC